MAVFVFGIILVVIGAIVFLVGRIRLPGIDSGKHGVITPQREIRLRGGAAAVLVLGVVLIVVGTIRVTGATNVGIPVTFGKIGEPLRPGFHVVAPWTEVTNFSTRLQQSDMSQIPTEGDRKTPDGVEVLSSEGGRMVLDVTVRYFIDFDKAPELYRQVGSMDGIRERVVRPDVRSLVRDVYSRYSAEEGYSSKREIVASEAEKLAKERLEPRGIRLDALKVRNITLEPNLQTQITAKLEAKQAAERALIDQQKAQTEAETRRRVAETDALASVIAAKGQAEANDIIAKSLSAEILRSKEIEAIAKNPNTVLYPFGQPITPLLPVGGGSTATAPAASPSTTAAAPPAPTTSTTAKP
jgi:regulator of protease activity HflC (stomatin/prohibitin superfamily)